MALTVLTFVFGLALLAAGGEFLIRSASRLAGELGLSRLFIGLTVVAFGTSAPEAVVSVMAAVSGSGDLALGNVIGSNILNVLLILGLSAVVTPLAVSAQLVRFDVPFLAGISVLCYLLGFDGSLRLPDGLLLLAVLAVHILVSFRKATRSKAERSKTGNLPVAPPGVPRSPAPWKGPAANLAVTVASLAMLVLGSRWLVDSASVLARWMGLSELAIGLTIVAAGTSLPEVATSLIAAMRGERDIAVGNVIGSNIFNILGVLGLSAALAPDGIGVPPAVLHFELPVMIAVAVLCLPIFFNGMMVFRWEGWLLLGYFVLYIAYVLLRASLHDVPAGFAAAVTWIVLPITVTTLLAAMAANLLRRRELRRQPHRGSNPSREEA